MKKYRTLSKFLLDIYAMEKFSNIDYGWFEEEDSLIKEFNFEDFKSAIDFVMRVAQISEKINHHPSIYITYDKVRIETTTHDEGNKVTEKDYQLCREIDKIF